MITNTGGRDVVLQTIAVRGQTVATADIFYVAPTTIADLTYVNQSSNDKNVAGPISAGTANQVPSQLGTGLVFSQTTTGPITLASGKTIAVYIAGVTAGVATAPGSVTVNDVGLTIAISVFSAQATYYKETNVNAA
jgi:hypothetical protein